MTTPITLPSHRVLIVYTLPESKKFKITKPYLQELDGRGAWVNDRPLPEGNWQILGSGLSTSITEEEAAGVVETVDYDLPPSPGNDFQGDWRTGYRDYESDVDTGCSEYPFTVKALPSLFSLIKSHGHQPERAVVLVEKIK